jgi:hypothetical protein
MGYPNRAKVFVPGRIFQNSLIFIGKVRSSPKSGASHGEALALPQASNCVGKACREDTQANWEYS